jgi:hypothetical protein
MYQKKDSYFTYYETYLHLKIYLQKCSKKVHCEITFVWKVIL